MSLEHPQPGLRATDQDRDRAAAIVQDAHADGRLDATELDERLTRVYTAKTQLELTAVTTDLVPLPATVGPARQVLTIRSEHRTQKRAGAWRVPPQIIADAKHCRIRLDFTEALVETPEIHVAATVRHGTVVLIVPHGWLVDIEDVQVKHGSVRNRTRADFTQPLPAGTVLLRVSGRVSHSRIIVRHARSWRRSATVGS
jgi:hypothetical protein